MTKINFYPIAIFLFYFIIFNHFIQYASGQEEFDEINSNWNGRWFPHHPAQINDPNPVYNDYLTNIYDTHHGIKMGIKDSNCDNGKTNLIIDWFMDPTNYTCFQFDRSLFIPHTNLQPILSTNHIPKAYNAIHKCMNEKIEYDNLIPTFGPHRPLWAKYGEYTFLPKQRWVHNLEHGAVVMLYHPCANKNEVYLLKKLVKKCLYRHIITPYNLLSPERPLALVTWGRKLEMSKVAPEIIIDFIKTNSLNGPEHLADDGQYSLMLEAHAEIVSDLNDSYLCKEFNFIE